MQLEEKCEDSKIFKKSMRRGEREEDSEYISYDTYQRGYSQPYLPRD
jgi:hypothetical protein